MNTEQLYEIVKDWPREAWPEQLKYWSVTGTPRFYREGTLGLGVETRTDREAAALFRDSGLRWLLRQGIPIITGQCCADLFWAATTKQGERWEGADLLLCISSAITRAKEGSNG